jgi:hypothetical protein
MLLVLIVLLAILCSTVVVVPQTSFSFRGSGGVDRGRGWKQNPSQSGKVLRCVRGAHFDYKCAPLLHRIATLDPSRSGTVLRCVRGAHFQLPWLSLGAPGCPWLLLGCSRAAPGCSWLLLGCSWLFLAAPGCLWLLLVVSGCC